MVVAQRAMWIKRYLDNNKAFWKETIKYYLNKYGGDLFMHCNFNINEVNVNLPPFYKECLKCWKQIMKEINYRQSPQSQFLWNNENVKINGMSVYYSDFMQAGIWTVTDLYENSHIIDFKFWKQKGIQPDKYMAWRGLIAAIPTKIKKIIKQNKPKANDTILNITSQVPLTEVKSKMFYQIFIDHKYMKPTAQSKYNIEVTDEQWKSIYTIPRIVFSDTKSRDFQYKCIHRIIPSNDFLHKIGKRENNLCTFCTISKDSFEHIFFQCPVIQHFWLNLLQMIFMPLGINKLDMFDIFFGVELYNPPKLVNQIIVIAKQYIVSEKCLETIPSFVSFKQRIKAFFILEQHGARINKDWDKILHLLT